MIDKLISIPGPLFLLYYSIFSAIVILLVKKLVNKDTDNSRLPEPTSLSPLDIALLSRGLKGVISSAVFNLWRLKAIQITKEGDSIVLKQNSLKNKNISEVEKAIYDYSIKPKKYNQLLSQTSLRSFKNLTSDSQEKLMDLGLIPNQSYIANKIRLTAFALILLLGTGGTKLYYGINRDKPYFFLILLILIAIGFLFHQIKPLNFKQTSRGKEFIKATKQRFKWVKSENKNSIIDSDSILFAVGIFGIAGFAGTALESILSHTYLLKARQTSTFFSSNSGAGCGGCSSGCGGGCSGGCSGGCGGGCGGCGS
jgi:uncharacterized protein (TIGR04222 family)